MPCRRRYHFDALTKTFEFVVFGAGGVGKSSIVRRFFGGGFLEHYEPTVEDFHSHAFTKDRSITVINCTDCSGSYQFPAMREVAIRKASGFALVFSLDSKFSFKELDRLLEEITINKDENESVCAVVVGNKSDLKKREVSPEEIAQFLKSNNSEKIHLRYVETSAKENVNVKTAFEELLKLLKSDNSCKKAKKFKSKAKNWCAVM